jgi:CheY-like chemotaxis protein
LTNKLILVVDDDGETREALSEFLLVNRYAVQSGNRQTALDEITGQHNIPALILLDVVMPVMDGRTFIGRTRQDSETRNVPIVVITAHPSAGAAGANAILSKPVRPERLLSLLGRFLQ